MPAQIPPAIIAPMLATNHSGELNPSTLTMPNLPTLSACSALANARDSVQYSLHVQYSHSFGITVGVAASGRFKANAARYPWRSHVARKTSITVRGVAASAPLSPNSGSMHPLGSHTHRLPLSCFSSAICVGKCQSNQRKRLRGLGLQIFDHRNVWTSGVQAIMHLYYTSKYKLHCSSHLVIIYFNDCPFLTRRQLLAAAPPAVRPLWATWAATAGCRLPGRPPLTRRRTRGRPRATPRGCRGKREETGETQTAAGRKERRQLGARMKKKHHVCTYAYRQGGKEGASHGPTLLQLQLQLQPNLHGEAWPAVSQP